MKEQWWLADVDKYGNVTLVDGAHSSRDGANEAYYLYKRLNMVRERMMVVKCELYEPEENKENVNEDALDILNSIKL